MDHKRSPEIALADISQVLREHNRQRRNVDHEEALNRIREILNKYDTEGNR